jgi:hypothetical protein
MKRVINGVWIDVFWFTDFETERMRALIGPDKDSKTILQR